VSFDKIYGHYRHDESGAKVIPNDFVVVENNQSVDHVLALPVNLHNQHYSLLVISSYVPLLFFFVEQPVVIDLIHPIQNHLLVLVTLCHYQVSWS